MYQLHSQVVFLLPQKSLHSDLLHMVNIGNFFHLKSPEVNDLLEAIYIKLKCIVLSLFQIQLTLNVTFFLLYSIILGVHFENCVLINVIH